MLIDVKDADILITSVNLNRCLETAEVPEMGKLTESMVLQRSRRTDLESVRELNCWFVIELWARCKI